MTAHASGAPRRLRTPSTTPVPTSSSSAPVADALAAPPAAVVPRLAARVASLPGTDPAALRRVRAVVALAAESGWGELTAGILAWRQLDLLALYCHLGRTHRWAARQVQSLTPNQLLDLLVEDGVPAVEDAPTAAAVAAPAA